MLKEIVVGNQASQNTTIGRLIWVPPCIGDLFYLMMMLTVAKEPLSYEDIRIVNNTPHPTFKETCFALGFLTDDREYIGVQDTI